MGNEKEENDIDISSGNFKALFNEKNCSCCGKYFIPAAQHMYRVRHLGLWQCSFSCWKKAGGENERNSRN